MEELKISATMRAMMPMTCDQLKLAEVPVPESEPGEASYRIKSVVICGSDPKITHDGYKFANQSPYYPFIMGYEWAGQIVEVGQGVKGFKPGDQAAGETHVDCGECDNYKWGHYIVHLNYGKGGRDGGLDIGHGHYGFYWRGANAGYNVYKNSALHRIPDGVNYDVASMRDCAGVAFRDVELTGVTPGGTSAVFGPGATGLCTTMEYEALGSGRMITIGREVKLEKVRELGADICIDFEKESPVKRVPELTGGVGADEVMECSGASDSSLKARQIVKKANTVAIIATYRNDTVPVPANIVNFNEIKLAGSKTSPNVSDQVLHFFVIGMVQDEKLITYTFPPKEHEKAVNVFEHEKEGSIKIAINP